MLCHRNSILVKRNELDCFQAPGATATWKPVEHRKLADTIIGAIEAHGMAVAEEEFSITGDGNRLFGYIKLKADSRPDYYRTVGFHHSNDKRISLKIVAGISVFICDNLMIKGTEYLKRKHTSGLELEDEIFEAVGRIPHHWISMDRNIHRLKCQIISKDEARTIVMQASEFGIVPDRDVMPVFREFIAPRHEVFRQSTRWSLYNAFTEVAKKYSPEKHGKFYSGLNSIFDVN